MIEMNCENSKECFGNNHDNNGATIQLFAMINTKAQLQPHNTKEIIIMLVNIIISELHKELLR